MPDFKIVSAVVHLDEKSPHAHIVGIPIGHGYKRGMKKQAAKTKVFTTESLHELQEKMHQKAEQDMEEPKSAIGKLVSGAWKKFRTWWDEKKRPEVEEKTRTSVRDKLALFKKQSEETKHDRPEPKKRRGMDIE